jgi:hypothetical protein
MLASGLPRFQRTRRLRGAWCLGPEVNDGRFICVPREPSSRRCVERVKTLDAALGSIRRRTLVAFSPHYRFGQEAPSQLFMLPVCNAFFFQRSSNCGTAGITGRVFPLAAIACKWNSWHSNGLVGLRASAGRCWMYFLLAFARSSRRPRKAIPDTDCDLASHF